MKPVTIDQDHVVRFQNPPTYETPELDNTVVVKRKLTIIGPDGKEVLVDVKLTGPISFKAIKAGTYVVKLESDAKDRTAEIWLKSVN